MTATFLPHCHLLGAVIYGAAQGPTFKDPLRITSDLLDIATQELVNNSRGLRYIVGDFNIAFGDLPHLAYWQSKGWKEIQLLQHSLLEESLNLPAKVRRFETMCGSAQSWRRYTKVLSSGISFFRIIRFFSLVLPATTHLGQH